MKLPVWMWTLAMSLMIAVVGCSKSGSVDTGKLESSFASADASVKSTVEKAVASIKEQNYAGAVSQLQEVIGKAKLTPDQEKAVKDVLAQVQAALSKAAGKAVEGADKAVGDLKNALPK